MTKTKKILKRQKEQGVVLIMALLIIAAMIIAGLAMLRSNETSNALTTNMLLKDSALFSGNNGLEQAIDDLNAFTALELRGNLPARGYYSTSQNNLDLKKDVNWEGTGNAVKAKVLETDELGNTSSYVIHRMCETAGAIETAGCMTYLQAAGNETSTKGGSGLTPLAGALSVYYRVTVKVSGPKGTEGYIQAMLYK